MTPVVFPPNDSGECYCVLPRRNEKRAKPNRAAETRSRRAKVCYVETIPMHLHFAP